MNDTQKQALEAFLSESGQSLNQLEQMFYASMLTNGGGFSAAQIAAYVGIWDEKPAANTLADTDLVFITDALGFLGAWFRPIVAANVYTPVAGHMLINNSLVEVTTDTSGTEQTLQQTIIKPDMLYPGFSLNTEFLASKSGATNAAVFRLRIGTAGGTSDTAVVTLTPNAASRSYRFTPSVKVVTSTSVSCPGVLSYTFAGSTSPWPADITIPNISNQLYLTLTADLDGTTDTVTLKNSDVYLIGV